MGVGGSQRRRLYVFIGRIHQHQRFNLSVPKEKQGHETRVTMALRQVENGRLILQIKAISLHYLQPGIDKVIDEALVRIGKCIGLGNSTQFGV